jgi:hypothetical protein
MSDWFTMHTLIAFVLGVLLCNMVKAQASNLKSKL